MFINGRMTEEEFNFISALSEGMEENNDAVILSTMIGPKSMSNKALVEAVIAKDFRKALKAQYNIVNKRCNDAEKFMLDESIPKEKRKKWEPELIKLMEQLNILLIRIDNAPE